MTCLPQCWGMSPEASQIQRGIRRQHWGPARDVQPAILTLRLRVDHVFAVLYLNAATACRTLARRECRFCPLDHFANVLSTSKFERNLLPPHGRPREGRRPTRGLVDVGRPSGLLPEGDAVGGGQLPRFVVVDIRSRSCVHDQSLEPWAAPVLGNVTGLSLAVLRRRRALLDQHEEERRCTCDRENDAGVEREADVHLLTHQGLERLLHTTEREPPNRTVRPSVPRPDRLLRRDDPEETYSEGQ